MLNMHATEDNYDACEKIIEILHEKQISVEQSYAILDYVKRKIAQDCKVGSPIKIPREVL